MHDKPHSEAAKKKMSDARKGIPNYARRRETVIVDGETLYKCGRCGEFKPYDGFYKDKRTILGITSQCRKCHGQTNIRSRNKEAAREANKLYMRRRTEQNPEKVREGWRNKKKPEPHKKKAREILNEAVRSGKIHRPSICQSCGAEATVHGHHEDYTKPLEVVWLCSECHGKRHRISREEAHHG